MKLDIMFNLPPVFFVCPFKKILQIEQDIWLRNAFHLVFYRHHHLAFETEETERCYANVMEIKIYLLFFMWILCYLHLSKGNMEPYIKSYDCEQPHDVYVIPIPKYWDML